MTMIESASKVVCKNPNVHFVVGGHKKEPLISELLKKVNDLGISGNIHFIGFVNDSKVFLGQMDIYLLTSITEGFSLSTVEALATGLPIVATRCGGAEEILKGTKAKMARVKDCREISNCVIASIEENNCEDDADRNPVPRFEISNMIDKYAEIYNQVLKKNV